MAAACRKDENERARWLKRAAGIGAGHPSLLLHGAGSRGCTQRRDRAARDANATRHHPTKGKRQDVVVGLAWVPHSLGAPWSLSESLPRREPPPSCSPRTTAISAISSRDSSAISATAC